MILDDGDDELELIIQSDDKGKGGDVRYVLIIRRGIEWEIGLSVKHSRLSKNLIFTKLLKLIVSEQLKFKVII